MKRIIFSVFASVTVVVGAPLPGAAQQGHRILPGGDYLPSIWADPREPRTSAKLVIVTDGASQFGSGVEGEAGLGRAFPVYVFSENPSGDYVVLGIGGGVWGRFNMENQRRDHISTDWVFRIPLAVKRGNTLFQLGYFHKSSHLGDEYAERFGLEVSGYSRDELNGMVFANLAGDFQAYWGGAYAFNTRPSGSKRWASVVGIHGSASRFGAVARPFGGLHLAFDQDSSWRPQFHLQVGLILLPNQPHRARTALELHGGPSPQGEFHRLDETYATVGIYIDF